MPVIRYKEAKIDSSDPGVAARRLVGKHIGAKSFTSGISVFAPGAEIFLHTHPCEEIVVILEGEGIAEISGKRYTLGKYDLSFVPPLTPHRFLNQGNAPFTMMYVYPSIEASRDPVPARK
jgi:putative monooxygenase